MKKTILLILAVCLIFTGLPFFGLAEDETIVTVAIVHTNDIHARVKEDDRNGIIGLARVKSVRDDFTKNADLALTVDSGDLFHGQPIATLERGVSIAEIVNAVV